MLRNNKGFTLIEMLCAMFILMIGMLALLNSIAVALNSNTGNILRDEAVRIAEQYMNELKSKPFDSLASENPETSTMTRDFRGISKSYSVSSQINDLSTDAKGLIVTVSWTYKNSPGQHSINSVIVR